MRSSRKLRVLRLAHSSTTPPSATTRLGRVPSMRCRRAMSQTWRPAATNPRATAVCASGTGYSVRARPAGSRLRSAACAATRNTSASSTSTSPAAGSAASCRRSAVAAAAPNSTSTARITAASMR